MQELKEGVIKYYQNNKRIKSPIFGIIKITPQTLWHLENKDKYHKRTEDQLKIRYKCFFIDRSNYNKILFISRIQAGNSGGFN